MAEYRVATNLKGANGLEERKAFIFNQLTGSKFYFRRDKVVSTPRIGSKSKASGDEMLT